MLVGNELVPCIQGITIDEERLFCPFSITKKKGKEIPKFSDHNAMIMELVIEHKKKVTKACDTNWMITAEGLSSWLIQTEDKFKDFIEIKEDGQDMYNSYEQYVHQSMDFCFRRSRRKKIKNQKIKDNLLGMYRLVSNFSKKGKAQRNVARLYMEKLIEANTVAVSKIRITRIKENIESMAVNEKFSPNQFWKVCKSFRKKNANNMSSIVNENGVEIFRDELIIDAYKEEFKNRLRQREIDHDLDTYEFKTERLVKMILEDSLNIKEEDYTTKELDLVRASLKKGKSPGTDKITPELIKYGGGNLKQCTLQMMNMIKNRNFVPNQWNSVQITPMYKGKGQRKQLLNQRGIFLTQVLSKVYEKMIHGRIAPFTAKVNKFQAGARSRSTADQIFLLRSCINHNHYLNKPVILTIYDYSQCFDSLWLDDCLLSLWKLGVNSELLNAIDKLNRNANVVVKTPLGKTETFSAPSIVKQGTVLGSTLCSVSTGEVADEIDEGGIQNGESNVRVLIFMDDINCLNENMDDVIMSHQRVVWFSKKKRLELNEKKCAIMMVNGKDYDALPELNVNGKIMKQLEEITYLGDKFNSKGNNVSLVKDRVDKGESVIVNVFALTNECITGNFLVETVLLLYDSVFLPVLIFNSQAWDSLSKEDIDNITTIQLKYLKKTLEVASSTSNTLVFLELGILPVKYEINIKQLTFIHHILKLEENDPVKLVYREQVKYRHEKNWGNEIVTLLLKFKLPQDETEITNMEYSKWKEIVKTNVKRFALKELNEEKEKQSKSKSLPSYQSLKRQDYFNTLSTEHARILFKVRCKILDIKVFNAWKYSDCVCRRCNDGIEDVNHILNNCKEMEREENTSYEIEKVNGLELLKKFIENL